MTSRNVPRLRFKCFGDEWKKEKLGEISKKIKSYALSRNYEVSNSETEYVHYGDIHTMKHGIINENIKLPKIYDGNYIYLKNNDLVIADASEDYDEIGKPVVLNNIYSRKIVGGLHTIVLRLKNTNGLFIYYFMNTDNYKKSCYRLANGMKILGLSYDSVTKIRLSLPSLPEQQRIGNFFSKLDHLIDLHSQKLEQLEKLKRAYLQKMFPQKGEMIPRLRFSRFSGEWKKVKLNTLLKVGKSGGTPSTKKKKYYQGDIPFLSIKDVTSSNGVVTSTEKHITEEGLKDSSAWLVPSGGLTLSMYASVGEVAKFGIDISTSQAFFNMIFNEKTSSDFMYYYLKEFNLSGSWNRLIATGTQSNLNANSIKNAVLKIPSVEEQEKIYIFLNHLDYLINENSDKIEELNRQKKAYLQKMFI